MRFRTIDARAHNRQMRRFVAIHFGHWLVLISCYSPNKLLKIKNVTD